MLKSAIAGVALGTFALFGTAEASTVTISYFGQLTSGSDAYDAFGTGLASLTGQFLTLTYVFDTNRGVYSNVGGTEQVSGGGAFPGLSPALSASVTINNKTITFAGTNGGYLTATTDTAGNVSLLSQGATFDPQSYTFASTALTAPLNAIPGSITGPLNIQLGGAGELTAFGLFGIYDPTKGLDITGSFDARSIAISSVPLPSALPLFGLALAGLGAAAVLRNGRGRRVSL